jgi:hypothetical protein
MPIFLESNFRKTLCQVFEEIGGWKSPFYFGQNMDIFNISPTQHSENQ